MQGETVTTYIDTNVIYPRVTETPASIYSFLLTTGYLKIAEIVSQGSDPFICTVEIPNKEIAFVYSGEIGSKGVPIHSQSTADVTIL